MSISKLIGPMPKMIKGQKGHYYKFADGLSSNGEGIELYFKISFLKAPYMLDDNMLFVDWFEVNVLWVGPDSFPKFSGGWEPIREGEYLDQGVKRRGILIGKMFSAMGEFNADYPKMHQWAIDNFKILDPAIKALVGQINGKVFMPIETTLAYLQETLQKDSVDITPKLFLNKAFLDFQHGIKKKVGAKFAHQEGEGSSGG